MAVTGLSSARSAHCPAWAFFALNCGCVCVGDEDIVGILTRTKVIVTWTMILGRLSVLELVIIKVNLSNQRHRLDK